MACYNPRAMHSTGDQFKRKDFHDEDGRRRQGMERKGEEGREGVRMRKKRGEDEKGDADALVWLSPCILGHHVVRDHVCIVHWLFFSGQSSALHKADDIHLFCCC